MQTLDVDRPTAEARDRPTLGPDRSWRGLYRAGAWAAGLYVLLILVPVVLINVAPLPPSTGGAAILDYIAAHKAVYLVELVTFVGLSLPAMVVFLALYLALKHGDQSLAALGALIGIASEVVALALGSSPPSLHPALIALSDQYAAATEGAPRAALAAAAAGLVAVSNAVSAAGILTALGILLLSLAMRRGGFPAGVAWLGIATGAAGIVSEALRDQIGAGYYLYGLLLPAWFVASGWRLYRLGWKGAAR